MAIRRYGLGKFNTILDSYVYDISAEGWDQDNAGDVGEIGIYYGRLPLGREGLERIEEIAREEHKDELTPEERDLINDSFGAIYSENDQGFVYVDYYDTKKEYDAAWEEVEDQVEEIYEEGKEAGEGEEEEEGEGEEEEEEAEVED